MCFHYFSPISFIFIFFVANFHALRHSFSLITTSTGFNRVERIF